MAQSNLRYEPRLDGLRAFSVIAVVMFHTWEQVFVGGWVGVDIFFAISGYLITRILVREWQEKSHINLYNFYRNRVLRLLPALVTVLIFYSAYCIFSGAMSKVWAINFFGSLFYIMNWIRAFGVGDSVVGHTWSLSIEEQFYLVWPWVLLFLVKKPNPRTWVIMLIIAALTWKALLLWAGASPVRIYNGFDTHMESILIGCLIGLGWKPTWLRWPAILIAATIIFVFIVPWDNKVALLFGQSFVALCAAALINRIEVDQRYASLLRATPIVYIGRISYGIYLWHYPIVVLGKHHVPQWAMISLPLLSIAVAAVSFAVIERPFLRLKRSAHSGPAASEEDTVATPSGTAPVAPTS